MADDEFFDASDQAAPTHTFFEAATAYKDKDVPTEFPAIFEGGKQEAAERIDQFMLGLHQLFQVNTDLPAFMREGGTSVLDAWTLYKTSKRTEPDRRQMYEAVDAFAAQAFEELSQPDAVEGVIQSSRLLDTDPMETLGSVASAIEHLRGMFAMMIEEGDDFFFKNELYDKVLQSVSAYDAELQVDVSAQTKNLYQDVVFPLIRYYVAPRLARVVEDKKNFTVAYVYALSSFYGSVTYLRRAFADNALKEFRDTLVQAVKDSDLDELAEDLADFTVDAEVDGYEYQLSVLAYVLSAEEELGVEPVQAKDLGEALLVDRDPEDSVEKGRAAMLYRVKLLLDMAMPNGAVDRELLESDVRYRESFNVVNDILSRPDGQSRIGAMAQMVLEKYFEPVLDELTKTEQPEDLAMFWVPMLESTYVAAELHGLFEPSISLNREIFKFDDMSSRWLKSMLDRVEVSIGADIVSQRQFFVQAQPIGWWIDTVAGVISLTAVGLSAFVAIYAEYKNKTVSRAFKSVVKAYVQFHVLTKSAITAGLVGGAMIVRYGVGDFVQAIANNGTTLLTEQSGREKMAFFIRDNVRAFSALSIRAISGIRFRGKLEDPTFRFDALDTQSEAYQVGVVVANSVLIGNMFVILLSAYYDSGDARPGAMLKRRQAQINRESYATALGNLLCLNSKFTLNVVKYGARILQSGSTGMSLWALGSYLGLGQLSLIPAVGAGLLGIVFSSSVPEVANATANAYIAAKFTNALISSASVALQAAKFSVFISPIPLFVANVALASSIGASRLNRRELAAITVGAGFAFSAASTAFFTNVSDLTTTQFEDFNFAPQTGSVVTFKVAQPDQVAVVLQPVALTLMVATSTGTFNYLARRLTEAFGFIRSAAAEKFQAQAETRYRNTQTDTGRLDPSLLIGASASSDWLQQARLRGARQVIETTASALEMQDRFDEIVGQYAESIVEAQQQL